MYFKIQSRDLFKKAAAIDNVYFFDIPSAKKYMKYFGYGEEEYDVVGEECECYLESVNIAGIAIYRKSKENE
jgi:hypothetical protein